jgi:hypothetical protein
VVTEGPDRPLPGDKKVNSAEVLEALHQATGIPIVADFYTRLFRRDPVSARNQPLFGALNQLGDAMRMRWHKEDGWLQVRSLTFFDDRRKEVPNRLLSRWAESRRQHGCLSLDDLVDIAQLRALARKCWPPCAASMPSLSKRCCRPWTGPIRALHRR